MDNYVEKRIFRWSIALKTDSDLTENYILFLNFKNFRKMIVQI